MQTVYPPITVDLIVRQLESIQKLLDTSIERTQTACDQAVQVINKNRGN